jgi:sugar O-acyltransferase (sialic acid O-acetyltransferase NeuD family)
MKRIIIVGAGGFGREVTCWLEDALDPAQGRIGGYLVDGLEPSPALNEKYPYPVLGGIAEYRPQSDDALLIAIGEPQPKLLIAEALRARGARFHQLIHPTATVTRRAVLGQGVIMCPYSLVSADALIGDFVTVNVYASIGHDAVIGAGVTICAHADITGRVTLGRAVFVGSHAAVLPGVEVGEAAVVGAGAVVVRRVLPSSTVYAPPARTL